MDPSDEVLVCTKLTRGKRFLTKPSRKKVTKKQKLITAFVESPTVASNHPTSPAIVEHESPPPVAISQESQLSTELATLQWCEVFRPTRWDDLVGHHRALVQMTQWMTNKINHPSTTPKILLLLGPAGVGKTTAASLLLRKFEFEPVEINASDTRTARDLIEEVKLVCECKSITALKYGLVLDEVDGFYEGNGGMTQFLKHVEWAKDTLGPIICIANDKGNASVRQLKSVAETVTFYPLTVKDMAPMLNKICSKMSITLTREEGYRLLTEATGDARHLLNLLQLYCTRKGSIAVCAIDKAENPFDMAKDILYNTGVPFRVRANYLEEDPFYVMSLIFENYPNNTDLLGCSTVADVLSMFDRDQSNTLLLPAVMNTIRRKNTVRDRSQFIGQDARTRFPMEVAKLPGNMSTRTSTRKRRVQFHRSLCTTSTDNYEELKSCLLARINGWCGNRVGTVEDMTSLFCEEYAFTKDTFQLLVSGESASVRKKCSHIVNVLTDRESQS